MSYAAAIAADPRCADAHVNLGAWQHARGQRERAVASYRAALAIDPAHAEAHANLATYYKESDRLDEAASHYRAALDAAPVLPEAHKNLADILALRNDTDGARRHYEAALVAQPDYDEARYKLAALTGEVMPAAPAAYVTALFDGYAGEYDSHMTATLGYGVPQRLRAAVAAHLPATPLDLLDLGCGTGLSLAPFREITHRAVGVDLSPRMLEQAQGRGYDRLIEGEIGAVLGSLDKSFDLVLAADVFVYLGDLATVLAGCRRVLRPGGLVAFSVERGQPGEAGPGYRIGAGGRYAHSADYLSAVTDAAGFETVVREEAVLRREQGRDVAGFVVVLRRAH